MFLIYYISSSSVQFSCSVVSHSLRPHEPQHTRPPWCPSPTPSDLHTDFSGGRSGGLVFPSLEEFSTVCWDPQNQRLGIVNQAEVDVFLELSCFFDDPTDVGNLISGSSAFSKSSLNIWKFMVHVLLKPGLENFRHLRV